MEKKKRGCMSLQKNGKNYYQNNKEYYFKKAKIHKKGIRVWYVEYKKTLVCVDCKKSDFRFMEFDHINNDKIRDVSGMVGRGNSRKSILEEIAKCEPVCANCHKIRTWERSHK